jgi:hypothetical protein
MGGAHVGDLRNRRGSVNLNPRWVDGPLETEACDEELTALLPHRFWPNPLHVAEPGFQLGHQ